jgi:hypothetical protein
MQSWIMSHHVSSVFTINQTWWQKPNDLIYISATSYFQGHENTSNIQNFLVKSLRFFDGFRVCRFHLRHSGEFGAKHVGAKPWGCLGSEPWWVEEGEKIWNPDCGKPIAPCSHASSILHTKLDRFLALFFGEIKCNRTLFLCDSSGKNWVM